MPPMIFHHDALFPPGPAMSLPGILLIALLLDAVLGEPRWAWDRLPHPAVLMGRAVAALDARLNRGTLRRIRGILAVGLLALAAWIVGVLLARLGWPVAALAAAILIAQRSLVDHVRAVGDALRLSTAEGRRAVARIVGRDTDAMDDSDVARAAIESAAENFSDAVVAPAFWFLVAGLPGLILYKAVNTADSMIGHRTERYQAFGWAAARLDDALNIVPARASALLIAAMHGGLRDWPAIAAEARRHRSPNAGWPEAAMARALGVALSGPRGYHGRMQDHPFVNQGGAHRIGVTEIEAACALLWRNWAAMLAGVFVLALLFG